MVLLPAFFCSFSCCKTRSHLSTRPDLRRCYFHLQSHQSRVSGRRQPKAMLRTKAQDYRALCGVPGRSLPAARHQPSLVCGRSQDTAALPPLSDSSPSPAAPGSPGSGVGLCSPTCPRSPQAGPAVQDQLRLFSQGADPYCRGNSLGSESSSGCAGLLSLDRGSHTKSNFPEGPLFMEAGRRLGEGCLEPPCRLREH